MVEKLKNIPGRILEWWNKFDAKRKVVIISAVAVVIVALGILGAVLMRPTMVEVARCETTKKASEINSVLTAEGIETQVSDDGLVIKVKKGDLSAANLAMGSNGYPSADYDELEKVFSGGFSSTEADKKKRYTAYMEEKLVRDLSAMDVIDDARVTLDVPVEDGTILSKDEDTYVSVALNLNSEIDEDVANGLARFIATAVGNKDTSSVTILDSQAQLLFAGENTSEAGTSLTQLTSAQAKREGEMKKKVRNALLDTKQYDSVSVAPNLVLSSSSSTIVSKEYEAQEGRDEGLLGSERRYTTESTNGVNGTPGVEANDDTTYEMPNGGQSNSSVEESDLEHLPNSKETTTQQGAGEVQLDQSSISVVATSYVHYDEEEMERRGELEGTTFDEFMAANSEGVQTEVDDAIIGLVANATGIDPERISIVSYEIPFFQPKEEAKLPYTMILTIVMILLILGLLGFIVFKSTRSVVVEEVEPEVSVEELLASTRNEDELEDIEYDDKSEVRKMIEKFVDENPSAVAQLLRNWLNDDWE